MITRIIAAICALVVSPVVAISALAIKVASPGPAVFRTPRAGKDGEVFTMYKLRTMHRGPVGDARITSRDDERVFAIGRWLRRLKLDELTQLVNVVRGEMAIVGPRPEDPSIVEDQYTPFMRESLGVRPGLTSPGSLAYYADEAMLPSDPVAAQNLYFAELLPRKIALDMVYVQNRSRRYDAELVIRTICGLVGVHGLFPEHQRWEQREAQRLLRESHSPSARGPDGAR